MKQSCRGFFTLLTCLAAPVLAQPTIGGGTCSTSTLNGNFAVTITGRGVSPALLGSVVAETSRISQALPSGNLVRVFQAVGTANFDGQSKVSLSLVADTNQATATPLTWSGTYTVQANCAAVVTINSGGNVTLNILPYSNGAAFTITGSDAAYAYSGNGNTLAVGCSTSTLAGVYATTTTQGYVGLTQNGVAGAAAATGIAIFDGQGNVTSTTSLSGNALAAGVTTTQTGPFSGTYSLGSNCVGSGTLSNPLFSSMPFHFVVYTGSSTLSTQFYLMFASAPPTLMAVGNAFWINQLGSVDQTRSGAALHRKPRGFAGLFAKLFGASRKGDRA